jgi:glycyl-tRNA synthetase
MEMEFFCEPSTSPQWFDYWVEARHNWYMDLGMAPDNLRIRPHESDELSHYSAGTVDVEYQFPWGWDELEGIANRTDFDLKQHMEWSGEDLSYFDPESNERFVPHVIEPAAGATRTTFAFLIDAYDVETLDSGDTRTVLRLHHRLAPFKLAVLPLSKKPELIEPAERLANELRKHWMLEFDITQNIGKRYRRQDEIGTPYCVTFDFDSLDDNAVTVRDRDSMVQERIGTDRLVEYLRPLLG